METETNTEMVGKLLQIAEIGGWTKPVRNQRRGIAHPQPRVAVMLAHHLVNSANGYARRSKDAVVTRRLLL